LSTRIAYLVSQYPAANHTFVLREVQELRRLGLEIEVASIRPPDRSLDKMSAEEQAEQRATFYVKSGGLGRILAANLRVFFAGPVDWLAALAYSLRLSRWNPRAAAFNFFYLVEAGVIADWMRRRKLSHAHMHFTSTVGLFAKRIAPMRTSVTIHGPAEFDRPDAFYLREKIAAFDLIVAISEYGRTQLKRCSGSEHWNKFRVVRLGVDPMLYAPRAFVPSPDRLEILFVGRLAAVKAPQILLAALQRLIESGRQVHLRLAGDGPERPELEREVHEKNLSGYVTFEGWQTADRVRSLYRSADIFCLASLAEGIPVVLMEAMSMEIPCVATRVTGVPELIRDGIDGLLVAPSDVEELAAALARLVDDAGLRERIGKSGRARVLDEYDLGRNTQQLAAVFREFQASPAERGS